VNAFYQRQQSYYHRRAREYDATSWEPASEAYAEEIEGLTAAISSLAPADTLDVACGTGFLTQHLRGSLTILDASDEMLAIAAARVPRSTIVHADALPLAFSDASFERIFSSFFYDHLRASERGAFVVEAERIAAELVLAAYLAPEHRELTEQRTLRDGSAHEIHTTHFTTESLLAELGGGSLLWYGDHFQLVRRWFRPSA
jgi:demethylmenaquinone methyltransferase/2-methoxy-6-polyprenyl-1,4-benzoquinol methylase